MKQPELPKNKYIRYALFGAVGYGAYKLIKALFGSKVPTTPDAAAKDEKKFQSEGMKASYPDSQYSIFADSLYSAFIYWAGTDEKTIYSIMGKMNNNLDVAKLVKAFGTRRQEFTLMNYSLGAFITDELGTSEIANINKMFAAKKITYRF